MGVRIAYKSETVEKKKVKMGIIRPLPSVSHMQVKAHVCRQDPVHAGQSPCTQSLKNRAAYAGLSPHT